MKQLIKILYLLYVVLIFIFPIRIYYGVYLASLIAIMLTVLILIQITMSKNKKKFKLTFIEKSIYISSIGYIGYQIFQFILIKGDLFFHLEKIASISLFCVSISYLIENKDIFIKIIEILKVLIVFSIVSWGLFYILKIARIEFVGKNLSVLTFSMSQLEYGEVRFEWLTRHKSEFANLCVLLSIYITYLFKNNIYKKALIICCLIGISLSKSSTAFIIFIIILIGIISIKFISLPKKIKNRMAIANIYCASIIGIVYLNIDKLLNILTSLLSGRDILTLGSRTYIWGAAITTLKNNYWGYGKSVGVNFIPNGYYDFTNYSNGHNTFLQEFLEAGVIGGTLFIIIVLCILIILFKEKWEAGLLFVSLILINQMDIGMFRLNFHLMYFVVMIIIVGKYILIKRSA